MKFYCPRCKREVEVTLELDLPNYKTFRCQECNLEIKAQRLAYKLRKKKPDPQQCPFCKSYHTHEVSRKTIQDIWEGRITVIAQRRCDDCKKFYPVFVSKKLEYLYHPELEVIDELMKIWKELEKYEVYEQGKKVWLIQKPKKRRLRPILLNLSERIYFKVEVIVPNKILDSLPFRLVSNQLSKFFGWIPRVDKERKWLRTHNIKFPRKIRSSKPKWKTILINRGYGASEEERQKNTEELKLTLKKLFLYFPTRRLFAQWLHEFYWTSWSLSRCERELNRLGIKKLGYGYSLTPEQKKTLHNVAEEVIIKGVCEKLYSYLGKQTIDSVVKEALIDYFYPKTPKELGASPQQELEIKKELRKKRRQSRL